MDTHYASGRENRIEREASSAVASKAGGRGDAGGCRRRRGRRGGRGGRGGMRVREGSSTSRSDSGVDLEARPKYYPTRQSPTPDGLPHAAPRTAPN